MYGPQTPVARPRAETTETAQSSPARIGGAPFANHPAYNCVDRGTVPLLGGAAGRHQWATSPRPSHTIRLQRSGRQ